MEIIQCSLYKPSSFNGTPPATLVAWLNTHPDLEVGKWVTLKDSEDPDCRWEVISIGDTTMEKSELKRAKNWYGNDFVREKGSFRNVNT